MSRWTGGVPAGGEAEGVPAVEWELLSPGERRAANEAAQRRHRTPPGPEVWDLSADRVEVRLFTHRVEPSAAVSNGYASGGLAWDLPEWLLDVVRWWWLADPARSIAQRGGQWEWLDGGYAEGGGPTWAAPLVPKVVAVQHREWLGSEEAAARATGPHRELLVDMHDRPWAYR